MDFFDVTDVKIDKIDRVLNIILNIIKLSISLGVIFGFVVVYKYLKNINQLGIFTNVISQPYSAIAILIIFGFIGLFFYISLFAPFLLSAIANDNGVLIRNRKDRLVFWQSSIIPIIGFWVFIFVAFCASKEWQRSIWGMVFLLVILVLSVLFPAIIFFFCWYSGRKKYKLKIVKGIYTSNSLGDLVSFFTLVSLFNFILFIIAVLPIAANWIGDKSYQWFFLVCSTILVIANSFVAVMLLNDGKDKILNKISYYVLPLFFCFFYLVAIAVVANDLPQRFLYPIRFIEMPKDSGWYMINNNYTRKEDVGFQGVGVNGITTEGMEYIKKNFTREVPSEGIDFDEEKNKCAQPKNKLQKNALYGYMAWNLGEVKVFCPRSVEFYGKHTEEELLIASQKCLVLKADVLQPLDKQYIPY